MMITVSPRGMDSTNIPTTAVVTWPAEVAAPIWNIARRISFSTIFCIFAILRTQWNVMTDLFPPQPQRVQLSPLLRHLLPHLRVRHQDQHPPLQVQPAPRREPPQPHQDFHQMWIPMIARVIRMELFFRMLEIVLSTCSVKTIKWKWANVL